MTTLAKGYIGEDLACKYLVAKGYKILYRNWRCYYGEIDLIAIKDMLTFVEVKTVFNPVIKPYELFTYRKKMHLIRTVAIFLRQNNSENTLWKVDLICIDILAKNLVHYPHALGY